MIIGFRTQIMPEMAARTLCRSARLRTQFCGVLQKARPNFISSAVLFGIGRIGPAPRKICLQPYFMSVSRWTDPFWGEIFELGKRGVGLRKPGSG
jgi:hypothetical protein